MKYLIGLCVLTCSIVPGFGTTINFNSPTGVLGTSQVYGGITATGYDASGLVALFGKNDGGDENGVGLNNDSTGDHEITSGNFIQLNVSSLIGTAITIQMGSTTSPDAYEIFGSSSGTNTTIANVLKTCNSSTSSTCESSFTITPTLQYLDFTATAGNVLLSSISYTQSTGTPEPVSFVLAGTGLIGMYFIRRRKTGPR